ncbi:MAG: hypothetical protein KA521_09040 [Crocinitomicaceae bacterium]|nr:hypothetical protein [Crocinitomicaceae bacterium]
MKKQLTLITFVLISIFSFAQRDIGVFSLIENPTLFYEYPNEVYIGNNVGIKDFSIRSNNIEIVKNDAVKNSYFLYPKSLSESSLYFIDNKTKDTFDVKTVTIIDLPRAQIYWGIYSDGETVSDKTISKLNVKYPENFSLIKDKLDVTQWAVSISSYDETIVGNGDTLSEKVLEIIKNSPAGTELKISCIYNGEYLGNRVALNSSFKLK